MKRVDRIAWLLRGGASRRMGQDKAAIEVDGEPIGLRTARILHEAGWKVTVLGGEPIPGFNHLPDRQIHQGPLAALRDAWSEEPMVFVVSCDIPFFESKIADLFALEIGDYDAVMPVIAGRSQPLCALYSSSAFQILRENPDLTKVQGWVDQLTGLFLDEQELASFGLTPRMVSGANTQAELADLIEHER